MVILVDGAFLEQDGHDEERQVKSLPALWFLRLRCDGGESRDNGKSHGREKKNTQMTEEG